MRAISCNIWTEDSPSTHMLLEKDLSVTLEEYKTKISKITNIALVTFHIINYHANDILENVMNMLEEACRSRLSIESDMARLYNHILSVLESGKIQNNGLIAINSYAPFYADDVENVLLQISNCKYYKSQVIVAVDNNGKTVAMKKGKINFFSTTIGNAIATSSAHDANSQIIDQIKDSFE